MFPLTANLGMLFPIKALMFGCIARIFDGFWRFSEVIRGRIRSALDPDCDVDYDQTNA